jgi:hypothetical protein
MTNQDLLGKFILWTKLHPKDTHCVHCKYQQDKRQSSSCPYPNKYAIYRINIDDKLGWSLTPQRVNSKLVFNTPQCVGFLDTGNYVE